MVAYGFKEFFAPQIVSGTKCQTVRADRKRHAEPGEMLQLYQGMRTRQCRKIVEDRKCLAVDHIVIDRRHLSQISGIEINGCTLSDEEIEQFAREDGFAPEALNGASGLDSRLARVNMAMFWGISHPDGLVFVGKLIRWSPAEANV